MICNICGKELPDDSLFCENCGNKIDERIIKQIKKENENKLKAQQRAQLKEQFANTVSDVKEKITNKEARKKKWKERKKGPIIISSVVVVLLALILSYFLFIKERTIDKTVDLYLKAYEDSNEDKMLKYMFPKKVLKELKSEGEDEYLIEESRKLLGDDVKDLKIIETTELDEKLEEKMKQFFGEDNLDIDYKDIKLIYFSKDENESNLKRAKKIIAYKVKNKWYIVPGLIECIIKGEQSEDILSAQRIADAVSAAIANEEVYNFLTNEYCGVNISIKKDLDYLPDYVKEKIMNVLETIPEISCEEFGACDFAFNVTYEGVVYVYISTDTKIDEWRVYPDVSDAYYDGIRDDEGFVDVNNPYTHAMLLSSKSPILGYWSCDNAGMYIGYSESGGNEGFTIYFQSQDIPYNNGFELINKNNGYVDNYPDGVMYFLKHDHDTYFYLDVIDDDTIKLSMYYNDNGIEKPINKEYTFERGEISKDIYADFEGSWYNTMSYVVFETEYCDNCGCLHDTTINDDSYYHTKNHVTLYDGKTISNILLLDDNWDENSDTLPYERECFTIENDRMQYVYWFNNGYPEGFTCYSADSEEAKYYDCMNQYRGIVDGMPIENSYILLDVNNDESLELFVCESDGIVTFYSCKDGQVLKNGYFPARELYYTPNGNVVSLCRSYQTMENIPLRHIYEFNPSTGGYDDTHTFEIKIRNRDKFNKLKDFEDYEKNSDIMDYSIDGKKYNTYEQAEAVFNSFYDADSKIAFPDIWYPTLEEAYEKR